jgi:hypothetical protein
VRYATEAGRRAKRASGRPKRRRVIVKLPLMRSLAAKVVAGLVVLMSMFGGLALAGALPGQGSDDDDNGVVQIQDVSDEAPETEAPETGDADGQGENEDADDQGEDVNDDQANDDQGENEDADDQGDDDQGENEDADDQGEDVNDDQGDDDQGENEDADDQGDDDQGDDDQGEED